MGDEGHEGNESNEGNEEGHEEACHEEGGRGGGPDEEARNESNEGNEGHEEGNEGHEEVIAQYGQRRRSAEMISHGGVPRRALFTVPVLGNIQSSALCDT